MQLQQWQPPPAAKIMPPGSISEYSGRLIGSSTNGSNGGGGLGGSIDYSGPWRRKRDGEGDGRTGVKNEISISTTAVARDAAVAGSRLRAGIFTGWGRSFSSSAVDVDIARRRAVVEGGKGEFPIGSSSWGSAAATIWRGGADEGDAAGHSRRYHREPPPLGKSRGESPRRNLEGAMEVGF